MRCCIIVYVFFIKWYKGDQIRRVLMLRWSVCPWEK
jgi:hypothetical protein